MKKHLINILGGFLYVFTNYFVAYIPDTILKENTIYSGVPAKEVKTIERPDITPAV
jgi:hypothetical protein